MADVSQPFNGIPPGRIMALDLGEKRIGVAFSDEWRRLARSHSVLKRSSRQADFAKLGQIAAEQGVTLLLVGLPLHLDGSEGPFTVWARDYGADLSGRLKLPLVFWDESLSSRQAADSLQERGWRTTRQRQWLDAVAAAFILQHYLDSLT